MEIKKDIYLTRSEFNVKWYDVKLSIKTFLLGTLWDRRVRHEFQTKVKEVLFVSSGLLNCEKEQYFLK